MMVMTDGSRWMRAYLNGLSSEGITENNEKPVRPVILGQESNRVPPTTLYPLCHKGVWGRRGEL
jgi:hypothetical protein